MRKLTLVCASPGYGKTTLITEWIVSLQKTDADIRPSICWLSLDAGDNDPGLFLTYLVRAFENANAQLGKELRTMLESFPPPPFQTVLSVLINYLDDLAYPICLVLDDYQFITNRVIHEGLAYFLERLPATAHLIIATRSDPPLPLARLRARDQMVEIRADDLRFTAQEAAAFLNQVMGLALSPVDIVTLETRTEGWIAGLQMAAVAMCGLARQSASSPQKTFANPATLTQEPQNFSQFIEGFSGTNRHILDYLLEEVLSSQPPEIQRFLLHTSILKRLTAPLCDAIMTNDDGSKKGSEDQSSQLDTPFLHPSAVNLDYLEKANLFLVSLDEDRHWYRYHHLFADLLQARLYQTEPGLVARLLSRASEWCEQEGQVADAVAYALAAQDYQRAVVLIEGYWHLAAGNGEIETVWSWLDALPKDAVRNSAVLSIAYCWVLWLKGRVSAVEAPLVDAQKALNQQIASEDSCEEDAAYTEMRAQIAVLQSIVARYRNDYNGAVTLAKQALHLVPENLLIQNNAQLRSLIFLALASAYDGAGDIEKAVETYAETIHLSRLSGSAAGVVGMTYRMIGVLRLMGRLRTADDACREALQYINEREMARLPATGLLYITMSEILLERNELEAAEAHLSRGIALGKWSGRFDAVKNAAPALARLRQIHHDTRGALEAVQEAESAIEDPQSPLALAELQALRARILVRQGALTEAAICAEKAIRLAGGDRGQTGEMAVLAEYRVMLAQDHNDEAIARLTQSLNATEEAGWMGAAIEMHILRSLVHMRQGKIQGAAADLDRALSLAEPEGYVRVFLDEGQPMRLLLAQWLAHANPGPLRDYAIYLLSQFNAESQLIAPGQEETAPVGSLSGSEIQPVKDMPIEPLSQRELEVLHLMALGRTNQEIAQQLIVAPGTIKAHAASIYRKLDVANRTEAVACARQMGILP